MSSGRGVDYDRAAGEYATHRQIHPGVYEEPCSRGQVGPGSAVLERDLARGPVRGVSRYACVWGRKPVAGI